MFYLLIPPRVKNREMRRSKALPAGRQAPIRMINIAKTYRPNWDATHTPMFHQFEGLCIDKDINITHLKGTIDYFVKRFFGESRMIRLRPAHFQFTEPSFEVDVSCGVCGGSGFVTLRQAQGDRRKSLQDQGNKDPSTRSLNAPSLRMTLPEGSVKCKVCKSGWLELAGAGMVHPNVLKMGGIDPGQYSGWAFGFGPERCMMMREEMKIEDIRILYSGEVRFLEQF